MTDLRTLPGVWCRVPGGKAEYSLFRRRFHLDADGVLRLLVSADSRYNLYLDGKLLGRGPVRGDLEHYHCERYEQDVASGDHLLCAEVLFWSDGLRIPWSEVHFTPAFLLLGECGGEELSTPEHWRCLADLSRSSRKWHDAWRRNAVTPIAPMEEFSSGREVGNWKEGLFDDSSWIPPEKVALPCFPELCRTDPPSRWKLRDSGIPQMSSEPIRIASVLYGTEENLHIASDGVLRGTLSAGTIRMCSVSRPPADAEVSGLLMGKRYLKTGKNVRTGDRFPVLESGKTDMPTGFFLPEGKRNSVRSGIVLDDMSSWSSSFRNRCCWSFPFHFLPIR